MATKTIVQIQTTIALLMSGLQMVSAAPDLFLEGAIFDASGDTLVESSETGTGPNLRNHLELSSINGGVFLHSSRDGSKGGASIPGGINLSGSPVAVILKSEEAVNPDDSTFDVWRSSVWQGGAGSPVFRIQGTTGDAVFTGSNVAINGGGLTVDGSPVITTASALTDLDSLSFLRLSSGGDLVLSSTTSASSAASAALAVAGGISSGKDSWFNGVKFGRGGGNLGSNTAAGGNAVNANTTGINNSAFGNSSLASNTTGSGNSSFGSAALYSNTTGSWNSALGVAAMMSNTTGSSNTAIGNYALRNNSGSGNVGIGSNAGSNVVWAESSIYIGTGAAGDSYDYNTIVIGANAVSEGENTTVIGNDDTESTHLRGETVVDSLKISGAVIIEEAQGDISMGHYQ